MTNEEAIRIMQTYIDIKSESEAEALDLAIKALKFIDENYPKTFIDYLNGEQI